MMDVEAARERLAPLIALFADERFCRVEPPILQPASVFLDLSGEDIRRRLYLVQDPAGGELCLRPDYTIPVSLAHLATGSSGPGRYGYLGPVFRFRPGQGAPGEFLQAGFEIYGGDAEAAADAEILAIAVEALRRLGLERPTIRLGDPCLLMAFVAALDLPQPWPRRLRASFGRPGALAEALRPAAGGEDDQRLGFLRSLAQSDPAAARAAVEEMVAVAGIAPLGGRTPQEIAERMLEQAQLALDGGLDGRARAVLEEIAAVSGAPADCLDLLSAAAQRHGLDVDAELARFGARLAAMVEAGVPLEQVEFDAGFGRRLDYYTGFVFEGYDPARPAVGQVVGGGRYDRLLSLLGAPRPVPAVGCSLWLDRLASTGNEQ